MLYPDCNELDLFFIIRTIYQYRYQNPTQYPHFYTNQTYVHHQIIYYKKSTSPEECNVVYTALNLLHVQSPKHLDDLYTTVKKKEESPVFGKSRVYSHL